MTFSKPWIAFPQDPDTKVPVLDIYFRTAEGQETRELFVVDSGADVTMATRYLCEALGLRWEAGAEVELRGIVPREECRILARLHSVEIYVRDADRRLTIPICFADSPSSAADSDGRSPAVRPAALSRPRRRTSRRWKRGCMGRLIWAKGGSEGTSTHGSSHTLEIVCPNLTDDTVS